MYHGGNSRREPLKSFWCGSWFQKAYLEGFFFNAVELTSLILRDLTGVIYFSNRALEKVPLDSQKIKKLFSTNYFPIVLFKKSIYPCELFFLDSCLFVHLCPGINFFFRATNKLSARYVLTTPATSSSSSLRIWEQIFASDLSPQCGPISLAKIAWSLRGCGHNYFSWRLYWLYSFFFLFWSCHFFDQHFWWFEFSVVQSQNRFKHLVPVVVTCLFFFCFFLSSEHPLSM